MTSEARKMFTQAITKVLEEEKIDYAIKEAAFPAYAHRNPLVRHLMWRRISIVVNYLLRSPHRDILDFGCGCGMLAYLLAETGKNVTAYDIEYNPLKKAKKYLEFPRNIIWLPPDPSALKTLPRSFDAVVALDVLEHAENLDESLAAFRRLLKPGGEVVVSGPTENFAYRAGRRLAGRMFTGEYHKSNIYAVKERFADEGKVKTIARLYPPVTLFEIFTAQLWYPVQYAGEQYSRLHTTRKILA